MDPTAAKLRQIQAAIDRLHGTAGAPRTEQDILTLAKQAGELVDEFGELQVEIREVVLGLIRAGGGHGDLDPAHAEPHLGADLQELAPDRAAGGGGELGVAEPDPAPRVEQDVGKGGHERDGTRTRALVDF